MSPENQTHPESFELRRIHDVQHADVVSLVAKSDEYLKSLYPPESNHAEPLEALTAPGAAFFAGYLDGRLVACGAVKRVMDDAPYGEIKRVFVDEAHRRKHLASDVMAHLERYLIEHGITLARLEAGHKQPEALGLYRKLGYTERGPFGSYAPDPLSVFMEKVLTPPMPTGTRDSR